MVSVKREPDIEKKKKCNTVLTEETVLNNMINYIITARNSEKNLNLCVIRNNCFHYNKREPFVYRMSLFFCDFSAGKRSVASHSLTSIILNSYQALI